MARDSCLARVTAGVAVGGAVGGAVGNSLSKPLNPFIYIADSVKPLLFTVRFFLQYGYCCFSL